MVKIDAAEVSVEGEVEQVADCRTFGDGQVRGRRCPYQGHTEW